MFLFLNQHNGDDAPQDEKYLSTSQREGVNHELSPVETTDSYKPTFYSKLPTLSRQL